MATLYVESAALAVDVRLLLPPIARRDQDLARRLKRACDDVPLHVAEGMCSTGRVRRQEYGAALGSAREALQCVRAAEGVGYLREGDQGLSSKLHHVLDRLADALAA